MAKKDDWVKNVEKKVAQFWKKHSTNYNRKKREFSASFEIGCFHALLNYYEGIGYSLHVENLVNNEYRYLTTPNGNPNNFSHVSMVGEDGEFEIRQQVRINSYLDEDIAFAPDIVVLFKGAQINEIKDKDYASGKRPFYTASSNSVVAAHECKSMVPFPELLVSFVGMFVTAHGWYGKKGWESLKSKEGTHIAPTMFVGGTAQAMHLKMILALEKIYPINIIVGLHQGTWNLYANNRKLNLLKFASTKMCDDQNDDIDIPF